MRACDGNEMKLKTKKWQLNKNKSNRTDDGILLSSVPRRRCRRHRRCSYFLFCCFVRSFVRGVFFSLLLLHLMFSYSRIFTTFIFMEHEKKMYASPLGSYEH